MDDEREVFFISKKVNKKKRERKIGVTLTMIDLVRNFLCQEGA
jgi:hypothetical protein